MLWEGFLIISNLKQVSKKERNLSLNDNDKAKSDADLEKGFRVGEKSENFDTDEAHEHPNIRLLEADRNPLPASKPKIKYFPENYSTCVDFFQIIFTGIFIILGFGSNEIRKIRQKKEKHTWSVQVMEKLLELTSSEKYFYDGNTPIVSKLQSEDEETETLPYILVGDQVGFNTKQTQDLTDDQTTTHPAAAAIHSTDQQSPKESAMLLAAKHGVLEMVKRLFEHFPLAIRDTNAQKKNVVLLAAEYRQPDVYKFLHDNRKRIENVFRGVDDKGNSALHLAANAPTHKPWRINGAALQMQWELKWYKFVKESMPPQFFASYNNEGRLAKTIFHESHKEMVKSGSQWLTSTSESCSLVAALITTVAFASATTIPGGNGEEGTPPLEKELGFLIFALSSLVALCLSTTSVITFLAILTSRFDDKDFRSNLPWKLLIGLSSLFFSIVAMLASFCAGHFFLLHHRLRNTALVVYTAVSLPVAIFFAIAQLPLYYDLLNAIVRTVPRRSAQVIVNNNKAETLTHQNAYSK
ncbi:uncharacterized protein LOC111015247 [Momordica charantia]|uniref:Uncharacterized protein LOC111015247 n=1 Tax=Momordica charantia TaxID=3673 RepID=A0A6J1CWL6_MOMCH|nr:uncharacterized protein LOC111015247 [Momordica charantia]